MGDTKLVMAVTTATAMAIAAAWWSFRKNTTDPTPSTPHPLNEMFVRFPLASSKAQLSTGEYVTVPYHIYDGWASAIAGTCDLEYAKQICQDEDVCPVETSSGKALGMISFWDFVRANAGPHTECQFTMVVTRKQQQPKIVADASFATFRAIAVDPECYCLIAELYNNTQTVVAYNNELFALNAIHAETQYDKETGRFQVLSSSENPPTQTIVSATLADRTTTHMSAVFQMMWDVGYRTLSKLLTQPYSIGYMASRCHGTPKSRLSSNITSLSMIKPQTIVTQWYDPTQHSLDIGTASHTMKDCKFEPKVVFHYEGIEFCYLCPLDSPVTLPAAT